MLIYIFSSENTFHPPPHPLPLREGEGGGVIFIILCDGCRHESFIKNLSSIIPCSNLQGFHMSFLRKQESRKLKDWIPCQARNDRIQQNTE
ncbi:MAG: hypothetical protein COW04_07375 [Deltaproteobacteria bacterium CG12_big_fil_rev_8_21_14_0_65_43_10]|nr:MAG: hypothetical protein AUK23_02720 [Deltaproteobacteria bacterium CG2_30_43_15]PIQ45483.1 MAG: hypothetical protein COW04_07375 [Deltaproteobacteria bacterium CG12_big_fil_rev_8_21_14_0_65_43_10]PIU85479.1 MAG: hypothetical protein COS67_07705 [Deltaproteobacteria bacterium CG06_land_8_20_14_3_00_44_19]PIX23675.1 MAG: hypothetical protein COZ68_08610 [Deltaproteobacteria bacterium CG_4_8_14_3_um_filter_43_13]PIZ19801.1 MAG: hypothetical protein COY50_08070 [Deltaproteobacteria bacterium C